MNKLLEEAEEKKGKQTELEDTQQGNIINLCSIVLTSYVGTYIANAVLKAIPCKQDLYICLYVYS